MDRVVRWDEAPRIVGLSKMTIWRYIQDGAFPKPEKIGKRAVGWRLSVIKEWLDRRMGGVA